MKPKTKQTKGWAVVTQQGVLKGCSPYKIYSTKKDAINSCLIYEKEYVTKTIITSIIK